MRYSPKSDLKQILNTPEAKKAWSQAYDYITSNKLTFPNNQEDIRNKKRQTLICLPFFILIFYTKSI